MKRVYILENCWPNSLTHDDSVSVGVVVEDYNIVQQWLEDDKYNRYSIALIADSKEEVKNILINRKMGRNH